MFAFRRIPLPLRLAAVLLTGIPVLGNSAVLLAQCTETMPCSSNQPPVVQISPQSMTFTAGTTVRVTISVTDDWELDDTWSVTTGLVNVVKQWHGSEATFTGSVTLVPGTNTVSVKVRDSDGDTTEASVNYTYADSYMPPPNPVAEDSARLRLGAHSNSVYGVMDGYGTWSYATPAYLARDQARSVQLVYSSAQAVPIGFVQLDATLHTTSRPDYLSLCLLSGGTCVSLTNGGTEAFYVGDTNTVRLAAQVNDSGLTTGTHRYTANVRAWWDTVMHSSSLPVRALVINEQASPFGAGWTIAGLQRAWTDSAGNVAITDGCGRHFDVHDHWGRVRACRWRLHHAVVERRWRVHAPQP